jgi:hypothetical protein
MRAANQAATQQKKINKKATVIRRRNRFPKLTSELPDATSRISSTQ